MAKKIVKDSPKKVSSKTTSTSTKRAAKQTMLKSIADIPVGEIVANLGRIDLSTVDFEVKPYENKQHKKTEMLVVDGKIIAQTPALALANLAESDPEGLILQLLAYKAYNPYAKAN